MVLHTKSLSVKRQSGVTLIELLIVIVIIGILASIGVMYYKGPQQRARDSRRKSDLGQIASSLEMYRANNDTYPNHNSGLIVGCGTSASPADCPWGGASSWTQTNTAGNSVVYMKTLPQDPHYSTRNYVYIRVTGVGVNNYYLCANLENPNDSDLDEVLWTSRCSGSYNYGREAP